AHKPSVVLHNGTYYLYYTAERADETRTIALATATSPTGPWTKYASNPVLTPTASYEKHFLDTPSVLFDSDENIWKMWYSCGNGDTDLTNYEPKNWCYATSADGFSWTKYANNPIATPHNDGSWLSSNLGGMDVIKKNGTY